MTVLQICPFAVLNVVLFRCLFNDNRQTNNRIPFLGVLLIWQIGLGKIPKASPKENGDNYSLAFNTRIWCIKEAREWREEKEIKE